MKLENSFSVRAPIDEVWAALLDVERAAPCLPGARLIDRPGEDAYEIAIDVALGDAPVTFQGQVSIVTQDAGDRTAVLSVTADGDGEGSAEARLELTLARRGDLTEGTLAADVSMTGEVAAVDESALTGLVERLIDDFARNLAALLGGGVVTVNGADPASSTVGPAPFVELPPVGPRVAVAAAPAAEAREAEP
ncbi:MAG: SRPBCC family protein, partial [Solirubrobacteraceae bacterium]